MTITAVFKEGEKAETWYVILKGSVNVLHGKVGLLSVPTSYPNHIMLYPSAWE